MKTNAAQFLIKQAILSSMFPQPVGKDEDDKPVSNVAMRLKRRHQMSGKKMSIGELLMC